MEDSARSDALQSIIESVANSSLWSNFCDFLSNVGNDVISCPSYDAHCYEELYEPNMLQRAILALAQLPAQLGAGSAALPNPAFADAEINSHIQALPLQSACFTSIKNTEICCTLNPDLSLRCCTQDTPAFCMPPFSMLDNDNALYNCCKADSDDNINCSIDLCSDDYAVESPCGDGGNLVNKKISQTYNQDHNNLAVAIKNIKEGNDSWKLLINDSEVKFLLPYMKIFAKNLRIKGCNEITEVEFREIYENTAGAEIGGVQVCADPGYEMKAIRLYLGKIYEDGYTANLDFYLGHEMAHIYQMQKIKEHGYIEYDMFLLLPAFEISADILGAIISNYNNLDNIGAQYINQGKIDQDLCLSELPVINRANVANIPNLLETTAESYPHASNEMRGTILLKLSTMIKSVAKYLDHKASLYMNNQCAKYQFNVTQFD
jgi:hypothetical protein